MRLTEGGGGGAVARAARTCQKGGTLRCQKILVYHSVYKKMVQKSTKNYSRLFFKFVTAKNRIIFIQFIGVPDRGAGRAVNLVDLGN